MEVVTHLRERKRRAADSRDGAALAEGVCFLPSAGGGAAAGNNYPPTTLPKSPPPPAGKSRPWASVSLEPGRLRLWKLCEVTKLTVHAGLGSFTTRTRPGPPRLCLLSGTHWVTGLGRARIGCPRPRSVALGLRRRRRLGLPRVQALEDQPRSKPPWTLRPSSGLRLPQLRKCQPPLRTWGCHFRPHLACKRREVGFRAPHTRDSDPSPRREALHGWEALRTTRRLVSVGGRRSRPHPASACQRSRECGP